MNEHFCIWAKTSSAAILHLQSPCRWLQQEAIAFGHFARLLVRSFDRSIDLALENVLIHFCSYPDPKASRAEGSPCKVNQSTEDWDLV